MIEAGSKASSLQGSLQSFNQSFSTMGTDNKISLA